MRKRNCLGSLARRQCWRGSPGMYCHEVSWMRLVAPREKNVGWVKRSGPTEQFACGAILIALRVLWLHRYSRCLLNVSFESSKRIPFVRDSTLSGISLMSTGAVTRISQSRPDPGSPAAAPRNQSGFSETVIERNPSSGVLSLSVQYPSRSTTLRSMSCGLSMAYKYSDAMRAEGSVRYRM